MASTLVMIRSGAVGFIDWLDLSTTIPSRAYKWCTIAMIDNPPMSRNSLQIKDHSSVIAVSGDNVHCVWRVAAGLPYTYDSFVPSMRNEPDNLLKLRAR